MSAKIPANMEIKDLLKATGYDCPEDLQGKTFNEATSGAGGGGSITPYAEKEYLGGSDIVTALVFDHTQITGECTYTDIYGDVYPINLKNNTKNLWLQQTDVIKFELDVNGSKVTLDLM